MFDLFDLEKLFNSWLELKHSPFRCETVPTINDFNSKKCITIDVFLLSENRSKTHIHKVEAIGKDLDKLWDEARSSLFAYFMEVGKDVE